MQSEGYKISDASKQTLMEWQQLAISQFSTLSSSKKLKNLPVFALEHGFSNLYLELIFSLLLKDYTKNGVNRSYWLLWVIYSTEIGYSYTGEEYWQTFEEKISQWDPHHREDIRWVFKEFQKKYFAIKPTGAWANHFSIISLPITHAILPRDLQTHFASLLFFCRYKLRNTSLSNPESIGKLLSANSDIINSSRFQNFLQQEELVGRIALALLEENTTSPTFELILPSTLKRIVSDLEQQRNAKDWVQATRREIKPKIVGTGSSSNLKRPETETKHVVLKRQTVLKPKLRLHQLEKNKWVVVIEIPKLIDLFDSPILISLIKKMRFQISGVTGTWIPAEALLHNSFIRRLNSWPESDSLLRLNNPPPDISSLIDEKLRLTEQPWLFKVGNDGTATEVEGKFLRPGKKYIVLYNDIKQIPKEFDSDAIVECEGIFAKELNLPSSISSDQEAFYKQLGFEIFKTLTVWPSGLSARNWDGEGTSEWLTTERPCFGIRHDFELDDLTVKIGADTLYLKAKPPGEITFLSLDPLPSGQHILSIKPKSKSIPIDEGIVWLNVREPVIWTPGTALHNGLTAFMDPPEADFESFFKGKIELKVSAPQNRTIQIHAELLSGNTILSNYCSPPFSMPFSPDKFKTIRSQIAELEKINIAQKVKLKVVCEDIGQREFIFTRDLKPFRWVHQSINESVALQHIDETDTTEKTVYQFYNLLSPDIAIQITDENFIQKTDIKKKYGLFLAKKGNYQHAIIVSDTHPPKNSLAFLSISPTLSNTSNFNAISHLKLISLWYNAECTSFLARIHLEKIITVLVGKLFGQICGVQWANEELNFISAPDFTKGIELLSQIIKNKSIANVVRFRLANKTRDDLNADQEIEWFIGAAERCNLTRNPILLKTALRFASNPVSFLSSKEDQVLSVIDQFYQNPDLLRASRLVILSISKIIDPYKNFSLLFPRKIQ